jgi:hypothetical protein
MQALASSVARESAEADLSDYPETTSDDWASDQETLRSCAVSTCANAWGLVYSQLFDGLECEGGKSWQRPQR